MLTERGNVKASELKPGDSVPVIQGLDTHRYRLANKRGIPAKFKKYSNKFKWEKVKEIKRLSHGTKLYDLEVRTAGNFTHGTGIITHNTTFHSNSPTAALTRMKSDGITDSELSLLSFIMYITRTRIDGVWKRRVRQITEITSDEKGRPKQLDLFTWNGGDSDKFLEVGNLLDTNTV